MNIFLNKKAKFRYFIEEVFEAGIVLKGTEVKSIRAKEGNITDAYATFKAGELYITNFRIEPYKTASYFNHIIDRPKKLLLHKKELEKLQGLLKTKGHVLVPLKVFLKNNIVKIQLGLGRGKKLHDKRQVIKERDIAREMDIIMKNYSR